ncbi:TBC1 domain family member 24 [Nibea albiflora]|uniref:TBC1 domain family member 24 n=1 Tax=Nibea albiflora TaxID=240163 RepID=A0ACB7FLH2_NIBAL|nr:TBC1 domain family member 24 [Nibea albiflora]
MITISESDDWEISSSSGMKYGQFVDWEKIDPEAAERYQRILKSEHQQLKTMGRGGFWAMPHTLRAKAYYHIIHSINSSGSVYPDRDVYYELAKERFGEQKISTHPVPEYMEAGEIPRYCLNKAGMNSVKKILLCLGKYFPDMNFCPILPELVSLILHFSEDEAECFHSVSRLICYNDPNKRYIDQTFLTYRASCMTFGDLANRCCRGIRKLIASSHQNLFEFYSDWIMWIFADLPFTYAIRVLDVYLLEGYKVLYRVALALLSLYKVSVSSRVADVEDFRTDMKRFVQSIARHCTAEKLLEKAFKIPMATRRELNLLFNANKDSLMQKGVSIHQKRWVFGAFLSTDVTERRKHDSDGLTYFGTGECFVFTLRPNMERYQQAMVNIMTRAASPQLPRANSPSCEISRQTCCPITLHHDSDLSCRDAPGPQLPDGPFTAPSEEPMSAKEPKRPKEQEASMFIAGSDSQLIIGGDGGHALRLQEDLEGGCSEPCDTFKSIPLCKRHFKIQALEAVGSKPLRAEDVTSRGLKDHRTGPDEIVVKVISESDSNDASTATDPESSKQPEGGAPDKSYPCSTCGKVFDRPSKLERHRPVHTRKPKTLHQCQHCEKTFTQQEKLIRHQNCHSRTNKHPLSRLWESLQQAFKVRET